MKISGSLKKMFCISLISAFAMTAMPKRSEALVGLALADAPLAIAGAAVVAGAAGFQTWAYLSDKQQDANGQDTWNDIGSSFSLIFTLPAGILGIVLLDGKAGQTLEYRELDVSNAGALGVTQGELESYNSSINKINDVLRSVEFDLAQEAKPTLADSKAAWANYGAAIPTPAMKVVSAISAKALGK